MGQSELQDRANYIMKHVTPPYTLIMDKVASPKMFQDTTTLKPNMLIVRDKKSQVFFYSK